MAGSERAKHTPGPWKLDCYGQVTLENGHTLLVSGIASPMVPTAESIANARLIAAAPELLAALREIMEYNGGATTALHDAYVMERAHAAIAKAELTNG